MKSASRLKLVATVASVVRASTRPGAPAISDRVHAVPRLVRATVEGTYAGTTLRRLGLVVAAVVYVASPLDLLPEAVLPVLGAADDAVVLTWAVKVFFEETDRFIAWETGQGLYPRGARPSGRTTVPGTVVPPTPPGAAFGASRAGGPTGVTGTGMPSGPGQGSPARSAQGGAGDGLRRDRDVTGAAAPGPVARHVGRLTGGTRPGGRASVSPDAARPPRSRLPEGMRQAATDYVLETVRKRLER